MWQGALWSYENKIHFFGFDTKQNIWQKPNTTYQPEETIPAVKHDGGSAMLRVTLG